MISATDLSIEKQNARVKRSTDKLLARLQSVHGPAEWIDDDPTRLNAAAPPDKTLIEAVRSLE